LFILQIQHSSHSTASTTQHHRTHPEANLCIDDQSFLPFCISVTEMDTRRNDNNKIRVLQWNILADGLANDGFLSTEFSPIYENSKKKKGLNVKDFINLVQKAKLSDIDNGMVKKHVQLKKLKRTLRDLQKDNPAYKEEEQKVNDLKEEIDAGSHLVKLKKKFNQSPELKKMDTEVLSWDLRFDRLKSIALASDADIITFQEMDHLEQFIKDKDFGSKYTCFVKDDTKSYTPPKYFSDEKDNDLRSENYLSYILKIGAAFAPKTHSNAAFFSTNRTRTEQNLPDRQSFNDDGIAIFWKKDNFTPLELGFLQLSSGKKSRGVIALILEDNKKKKKINVLTTHLLSGNSEIDEKRRLDQLKNDTNSWNAGRIQKLSSWEKITKYPQNKFDGILSFVKQYVDCEEAITIFPVDTNSRPSFLPLVTSSDLDDSEGTNVWKSILNINPKLQSIWTQASYLNNDGTPSTDHKDKIMVSVNKMRGPASNQAEKIGEHQSELIDHIFTTGMKSQIREDFAGNTAPRWYASEADAELDLYPSSIMPSDHFPLIVDIFLC